MDLRVKGTVTQRCSAKKNNYSEKFVKLRGKHLCWSPTFNNVGGCRLFYREFYDIFQNKFSYRTPARLM